MNKIRFRFRIYEWQNKNQISLLQISSLSKHVLTRPNKTFWLIKKNDFNMYKYKGGMECKGRVDESSEINIREVWQDMK